MNINCIICSDLFTPTAETYTTTCGHMFHYACLIQWIERSKTCPQCRCKVTEKTIHRLYFNLQSTEGISEDVGALQSKVDNLGFQIKLKEKDIKIFADKYKYVKSQNIALRDEVKTLESKSRVTESAMHAFKEQIQYFKQKSKEGERMSEEVQKLKDRLRNMENLQLVLNGTRDQVHEMLRHNRDPESLGLLVSSLKKELIETDRKKRQIENKLFQLQNETSIYKKERDELKQENENLRVDVEAHINCGVQRKHLKRRISSLESQLLLNDGQTRTPNTSIRRIINESPAPHQPDMNEGMLDLDCNSPTVGDRVKEIVESDSPYLQVISSSYGFPSLLNAKFSVTNNGAIKPGGSVNTYTLYNNHHSGKFNNGRAVSQDVSYNGLGGHSKIDTFPSPTKQNTSLKRPKSSSYISTTKFRKLGNNNKKIEDFVLMSDTTPS